MCTRKVMVKKASIAGPLDQLEFRVKSTCEMLGLDIRQVLWGRQRPSCGGNHLTFDAYNSNFSES